jgi:hypothetical protein
MQWKKYNLKHGYKLWQAQMSAEARLHSLQGLKSSSAELVTHMQCISQKMQLVNEQMEGLLSKPSYSYSL